MALVTPVALSKVAFDATQASIFNFTSNGGSQVVKNRLTIRNNATNVVVYQNTVTTFTFQQEVPANTLTNGVYYNFYFNTYDIDNNISSNSNVVAFYCYAQPTITLTNAPSTNIINASSYTFNATYAQASGELLDYLIYYLYDSTNAEISNSGKLYSALTPPLNFTHTFSGFENNTIYRVKVRAISVNGTITESALYTFTAQYFYPNMFSLITLENKCDDGYVQVQSNVILAEGVVNPNTEYFMSGILDGNEANYIMWDEWYTPTDDIISVWAEPYAVDITTANKNLTWSNGIDIPSNFQMILPMRYNADGKIIEMFKTGNESNKLYVELKRGIPFGETTEKCWFVIYTQDGRLMNHSNYVDVINGESDVAIFINKIGNAYTLTFTVVNRNTPNSITYGTMSNVIYGITTDIAYGGMVAQAQVVISTDDISDLFPMDNIVMYNGKFDNIDISTNTDRAYTTNYPDWDFCTRLNCDFSTLNGGNIDLVLSQVESIRIKRRTQGSFDWITLYDIPILSADDLNIVRGDCGVPTGETFEYAIVPVMSGSVEGDYIISEVTTNFRWCYLCDGDNILKFYSNVSYPTITSNPSGGLLAPIGRQKPITIYNADSDYESGTFTGNILGDNFLTTRVIDRKSVTSQVKTYKQFINNKKPKFLKDWNGKIKIVDTNVMSGTTETVDLVNGKSMVSFSC